MVEENNVADYTSDDKVAYYPEDWYMTGSMQVDYLTSIKDYQVVTSVSIVLAADKIDSTLHEFIHVLDCCLGYEHRSDELQQIHHDIDCINAGLFA